MTVLRLGTTCKCETCKRPPRFYGFCAGCWRTLTPMARKLETDFPDEPEPTVDEVAAGVVAEAERLLSRAASF
jgi:hypothetical protein